jgi:ISXO2-like transposase domain
MLRRASHGEQLTGVAVQVFKAVGIHKPVVLGRERRSTACSQCLGNQTVHCLSMALKPHIPSDAVLCTDGSPAMAAAAKELGVQHEPVNLSAGQRVRGPWHIQNANAYHSRLKGWIARFKGVATDYLESYLGWFRALDRATKTRLKVAPMLALAVGLGAHHQLTTKEPNGGS